MGTSRALLIDAEACSAVRLREPLAAAGFELSLASSAREVRRAFAEAGPALVVIRLSSALPDAAPLVRQIRCEAGSWIPILLVVSSNALPSPRAIFAAGQEAATELLVLPEQLDELPRTARRIADLKVQHLRERRRRLMYHDLRRTLEECHGVIAQVAERMGADRTTVYYHLKKFGLY